MGSRRISAGLQAIDYLQLHSLHGPHLNKSRRIELRSLKPIVQFLLNRHVHLDAKLSSKDFAPICRIISSQPFRGRQRRFLNLDLIHRHFD